MNRREFFVVILTLFCAAALPLLAADGANRCGPYVWWHWLGSNVSEAGIRRDIREMAASGIAGATIFNITAQAATWQSRLSNCVNEKLEYRNAEYWRLLRVACEEAKANGVELGLHNCPGFSVSGGPWIDAAHAMKKVVMTSAPKGTKDLPQPETNLGFYREIATVEADGKVWRVGYTCTGAYPNPQPLELEGKSWECDKMSAEATRIHLKNVLEPLKSELGEHFGTTFKHITMDSYEAGGANWTDDMREEFTRRRGYDPVPFLPVLGGAKIEGAEKFRQDLAKTVSELYCERHYAIFREELHKAGLTWYFEPYHGPFDSKAAAAYADVPMIEFWASPIPPREFGRMHQSEGYALAEQLGFGYSAPIIASEAFTGHPHNAGWVMAPRHLKSYADAAFAHGVNRLFLHHWVHQPFDESLKPGMTMGWWGTHFGENQTWHEPGKAFYAYLTRCQELLQRGKRVTLESVGASFPTGIVACARRDGRTTIVFSANIEPKAVGGYGPYESRFTVTDEKGVRTFNPVTAELPAAPDVAGEPTVLPLVGSWGMRCTTPGGIDHNFVFERLHSWSESDDRRLKYFSGTVKYWKSTSWGFGGDTFRKAKKVVLRLGDVREICRVSVNGIDCGVVWCEPFEVDVTHAIKPESNYVEIDVTNTWANRMIGDDLEPDDCEWAWTHDGTDERGNVRYNGRGLARIPDFALGKGERPSKGRQLFSTWDYYASDSKTIPAGLLGPVEFVVWTDENAR